MADLVPVTYIGSQEEVQVGLPDGGSVSVARGESVEVPASVANGDDSHAGLLTQTLNWRSGKGKKTEDVEGKS